MTQNRPGGLTALAVLNFCAGAWFVIQTFGFAVAPFAGRMIDQTGGEIPPEQRAIFDAFEEIGTALFMVLVAVSFIRAVLFIVSGVGYLKLKKFLGYKLGNVCALISLIYVLWTLFLPPEIGGGFTIALIIGSIYPLLTLILLNTTFKEDFVN